MMGIMKMRYIETRYIETRYTTSLQRFNNQDAMNRVSTIIF